MSARGSRIRGHEHVINADLGWFDSKSDPRNSLENYRRLTASARLEYALDTSGYSHVILFRR